LKRILYFISILYAFNACTEDIKDDEATLKIEAPVIIEEYGYILNDFNVIRDTIHSGDTFGDILDAYGVSQQKIFEAANKFRDSFDVRKIKIGNPYVLLNSKDSLNTTQVFIYEKNKIDYAVLDIRDTLNCYTSQKPIRLEERTAAGIITSSLSQTMEEQNLSANMTDQLAKIYAWTVNFFHLQEGDRFKVIYTEKYINDTIPAGIQDIKAAYFEHRGKPLYSFNFETDSIKGISDYYDEKANNLRRAFLKAPVKFSRISSRYNLNRRIKYYGFKLKPHKGTDFAAPIGTPILATADGTVTKSEKRGGNGNYVKIQHNGTYETQYLHMKNRNVRLGEYVQQGDVIGWVGMTGNSGGPHVCYRFWKNGRQIDPLKEDLPLSKPLPKDLQGAYFAFVGPIKDQLDCITY
jgi:murein DD-endopeptidase MepM/ murein hydrolase activator NlpD